MRAHTLQKVVFAIAAFIILMCRYASAEVINFDDLERVDDPFWAAQEVTNEYESKGLIIDGGYLGKYWREQGEEIVSGPNYLQGGPYLYFSFVGKLPKFVSLVVTSNNQDVVYLGANCGDGSVLHAETPGWAGPEKNTPFKAKNVITFVSQHGISSIGFGAFYFLRTSAMIDDVTYHYELPEPAPLLLFGLGLFALILSRTQKK